MRRVAVVGAGWAGLAAAVHLTRHGVKVTVFEMADRPGGRARSVVHDGELLDNGQHILIGAYRDSLALMRSVGLEPQELLLRHPLALVDPRGQGLRLPSGPAVPAFVRGVLACSRWAMTSRLTLLAIAVQWQLRAFRCDPLLSVAELCRRLPLEVRRDLVDPLCVAALNTPSEQASATVFLRVLKDALFSGPGAADLLLPRRPMGELLPEQARRWLEDRGVEWQARHRVLALEAHGSRWHVDSEPFDAVILACSPAEAGRLVRPHVASWAAGAEAIEYEPIVTVTLQAPGIRLPLPMVALTDGPAQFVFDHGQLQDKPGQLAFVISGAAETLETGRDAVTEAVMSQASRLLEVLTGVSLPPAGHNPGNAQATRGFSLKAVFSERRATFRCTPGLVRPPTKVLGGLMAAGDYVAGPYPSTLEGAVRSGQNAAREALQHIS